MSRFAGRVGGAVVVGVLLAASAPAQSRTVAQSPAIGDVIPAFESMDISGKPQKVDFPRGRDTVLLFFLSSCPHCHKMIPEWNRAFERKPKGLAVMGVIMDQEPPGFWATLPIAFPVVRAPGREYLRSINVNRAPLAVRVGPGGKIEDLILGETDPIRLGELFKP